MGVETAVRAVESQRAAVVRCTLYVGADFVDAEVPQVTAQQVALMRRQRVDDLLEGGLEAPSGNAVFRNRSAIPTESVRWVSNSSTAIRHGVGHAGHRAQSLLGVGGALVPWASNVIYRGALCIACS